MEKINLNEYISNNRDFQAEKASLSWLCREAKSGTSLGRSGPVVLSLPDIMTW